MIGELIGAATSVVGGLMGNKAQKQQNKYNEALQAQEYARQKEFAQSGIQWKVSDAEKAGIHPLYALGAQTTSYAPSQVGGGAADYSFLANAGQNIGRAIDSTRGPAARLQALQLTGAGIELEGKQLDNEIKKATLASAISTARQAGTGPGIPSLADISTDLPGSSAIEGPNTEIRNKISPVARGAPQLEFGAGPEVRLVKTKSGWAPVIPEQLSESFEQDWPSRYQWMARNKLFTDPKIVKVINRNAPRTGFRPTFDPLRGEYVYKRYPTFARRNRHKGNPYYGGF